MKSHSLATKLSFLLFLYIFTIFGISLASGQSYSSQSYNQYNCDHNRLQRCQQDVVTNIQDLSNSHSGSSGYSGISSGYQSSGSDSNARCSAIRQNLDCLLLYTPGCINRTSYTSGSYGTVGSSYDTTRSNFADFVRRAKVTLERYCEQGGGSWKSASCYLRQDLRDCESRYGFQSNPPSMSSTACRNYDDFRNCVVRIVRQSCYTNDLQMISTYLVDKAQELSWSCVVSPDYDGSRYDSNYDRDRNRDYNRDRDHNYGSNHGSAYDRDRYDNRDRDRYDRDRYDRDRDRSPYDRDRGYGSGYDSRGGSGDCLENVGYFLRSCEDQLTQRQRDARDYQNRNPSDSQRRMCCALYYYRDCVSRLVQDRCRDPTPYAVDILMGSRKRDLTFTCRDYSRDTCSHSSVTKYSLISMVLSIVIAIKFIDTKLF